MIDNSLFEQIINLDLHMLFQGPSPELATKRKELIEQWEKQTIERYNYGKI